MRFQISVTGVVWLFGLTLCVEFDYDRQISLTLNHALDSSQDPIFTPRGAVQIRSISSGITSISQNPLNEVERKKLKALIVKDGLYRVQTVCKNPDGTESTFLTFLKGHSLYQSRLSDYITINLDHLGNVISVTLNAAVMPPSDFPIRDADLQHFNTTVLVQQMESGPIPDTASYIQKLEQERLAKERGETKDNRSFLAKYWMYIVPILLLVFLSSSPAGAEGGGGGR